MLPRLIATDLDGTLLDPNGLLRPRSAAALQAAADAGIIVVFATGRPPVVAVHEVAAAGHGVHYGVMANGTIVCSLPDREVLHAITFPTETARAAVHALRAHDAGFGFAMATDAGFTAEPGFHQRMPVHHGADDPVPDALVGHEGSRTTLKLLAFHHTHGVHDLLRIMPPLLGTNLAVTHMGAEAVEIGPAGADKGVGLRWLCDHLGIAATDVLVFGDEINDLPMFQFAGRCVAVANASPQVREAADEIAPTNAEEGVAQVIERLLGGRQVVPDALAARPRDFPARQLPLAGAVVAFLGFIHATTVSKLVGLTDAQARTTPLPTSPVMSPLGLVKHLTAVLRQHIQIHIGGHDLPSLWRADDHDFEFRLGPADTINAVVAAFDDEYERSLITLAAVDLEAPILAHGLPNTAGRLLVDVLQECARHLGHLDIVRELIDGSTGE